MPRSARIHFDNVPLHIVQRGHNHQPCFFYPEDYRRYLQWLGQALDATQTALHAYVLMTNHVHLLLTPSRASTVPSLIMSLGRRYVQYVNRRYARTGTLWDSRYKSSLIQAETYLLACHRYIELNPVRAAMVRDPGRYRWSSYRHYAFGVADALVDPRPEWLALGSSPKERQEAYRALVRQSLDRNVVDNIRLGLNQGRAIGNRAFHAMIERTTGQRREPAPRGRPRKYSSMSAQRTIHADNAPRSEREEARS